MESVDNLHIKTELVISFLQQNIKSLFQAKKITTLLSENCLQKQTCN